MMVATSPPKQHPSPLTEPPAHPELGLVEAADGVGRVLAVGHGHKGKPAGAAALAVLGDEGILLCLQGGGQAGSEISTGDGSSSWQQQQQQRQAAIWRWVVIACACGGVWQ